MTCPLAMHRWRRRRWASVLFAAPPLGFATLEFSGPGIGTVSASAQGNVTSNGTEDASTIGGLLRWESGGDRVAVNFRIARLTEMVLRRSGSGANSGTATKSGGTSGVRNAGTERPGSRRPECDGCIGFRRYHSVARSGCCAPWSPGRHTPGGAWPQSITGAAHGTYPGWSLADARLLCGCRRLGFQQRRETQKAQSKYPHTKCAIECVRS